MKQYRIFYDKHDPFSDEYEAVIEEIVCDDIYHTIGKMVVSPFEEICNIGYVVIDESNKDISKELVNLGYKKVDEHYWIKNKDKTFFDEN